MELKFRVSMRDDDGDSNQASKPVKKRGKIMLPKGLMQKRQTSSQVKIKQPEKRETEEPPKIANFADEKVDDDASDDSLENQFGMI